MAAAIEPSTADVLAWLDAVPDPEIPAISIRDLGIVREVRWSGAGVGRTLTVAITPTYAGCPAMRAIHADIVAALRARGIVRTVVETRLAPAWSTDWLTANGREKLRAYGISPPRPRDLSADSHALDLVALLGTLEERAVCPRCNSHDVALVSRFGSTPCKALYRCVACREPFDHFKAH